MNTTRRAVAEGMRAGIPIALGYFAVAFSLGIAARDAGFSSLQGFVSSMMNYASSGQFIGYTLFAAKATLWQLVIVTLVTNARYLLMGFSLNQRFRPDVTIKERYIAGWCITDEIFGVTIGKPGYINPYFMLGAWVTAVPAWSLGVMLGIILGNLMPVRAVSALSVALYGMFLAVIIPPGKKDPRLAICVIAGFAASYALTRLPIFAGLGAGNRTIILTVVLSALMAIIFPTGKNTKTKGKADPGDSSSERPADGGGTPPSRGEEVVHG